MKELANDGIDYAENGFLQRMYGRNSSIKKFCRCKKLPPTYIKSTQFLGFRDNSRYSLENHDNYRKSFKWFRISFAQHVDLIDMRKLVNSEEELPKKDNRHFIKLYIIKWLKK